MLAKYEVKIFVEADSEGEVRDLFDNIDDSKYSIEEIKFLGASKTQDRIKEELLKELGLNSKEEKDG